MKQSKELDRLEAYLTQKLQEAEPPLAQVECAACEGSGHIVKGDWVYENGCGFGHSDSYEVPCEACGGIGFFLCEAEPDA